jgi:hypothetical protein
MTELFVPNREALTKPRSDGKIQGVFEYSLIIIVVWLRVFINKDIEFVVVFILIQLKLIVA